MSSVVTPLANNRYQREEEQVYRDLVRRNISETKNAVIAISERLRFANIPEYADDTAAGVGGLIQGQFYHTATGVLMVKL